jgi:nicotinate-nucleotide pyrophosphorylase (carboxylating)
MTTPGTARLVDAALEEDAGRGDLTSEAIFAHGHRSRARILAGQRLVVCGADVAALVFARLDPRVRTISPAADGDLAEAGDVLLRVEGPTLAILAAERTALNFLQRLCGVATLARAYADAVKGTGVRVVDTRKTTPGLRALEKRAVRCGGCFNHRHSLGEHVLIKDNHIAAAGSLKAAVRACRAAAPHTARVEVEAKSPGEVAEACAAGADVILLDNMSPGEVREAVGVIASRALVEVSGGVRLETIRNYAMPGVDVISVGALTHSAPAADISLDIAGRGR